MGKIKIAVIGVGNISESHINGYKNNATVELYAFCDINETQLKKQGEKYGVTRLYTDMNDLLALPEIDAVSVCTWNAAHAPCTIAALNAGKHVLCEKPMSVNKELAMEMQAAAEKNGKVLMIGFVRRFGNDCAVLQDFINNDFFGELYYAKATYLRRKGNPGGWFADKARSGGGPIIDLGVHVIDLTRYLMGNPKPVSVYAVSSQRLGDRKFIKTGPGWVPEDAKEDDVCTVEDFATALIRYDNGACTFLETSYDLNGEDIGKKQLFGTKGGMDLSNGVKIYTTVNDYMADIDVKTANLKGGKDMFVAEMSHFIDCVKNGTPCRAKAEDGIAVMKILDAIYESARTGHEVIL